MGKLNTTNTAMESAGTGVPVPRTTTWALDNLGNWSADDELYHSVQTTGDFDGDGQLDADSRFRHHNVNSANEINQVVVNETGITGAPAVVNVVHDPAGNLVFDGKYVYMYDAWNRLLSVNFAGSMAIPSGRPDSGRITDASQLGAVVCWFSYDGLGRLLCKSTPVNEGVTGMQSKSMYYDGVRRIAEVISRPPPIQQGGGLIQGGAQNNENPLALDGEDPPPQQIIQPPPDPIPVPGVDFWTDRQYVYGPEYVDEFLWQVPTSDMPAAYMLQDGNYNVMALVDAAGAVLTQQTFEPYGTIATFEKFENHAVNRVGHQGLFFERFDGTYADPTLSTESDGFYYNRNRFYDPVNGRFTSRDPNETGIPILTAMAMNGDTIPHAPNSLHIEKTYGNGMNLFAYESSNPLKARDPNGLDATQGDFDLAIDDQFTTQNIAMVTLMSAEMRIRSGVRLANAYAAAAFGWMNVVWDQNEQALFSMIMGPFGARACFDARTLVLMADGTRKPIAEIRPGDEVLCDFDPENDNGAESATVCDVYSRFTFKTTLICIKDETSSDTVLLTPEHPIYSPLLGKFVEAQLLSDTSCATLFPHIFTVASCEKLIDGPRLVYNLNVNGAHTYYVAANLDSAPILVHNTCFRRLGRINNAIGHSFEMAVMAIKNIPKYGGRKLEALGTKFVPDFLYDGIIGDIKSLNMCT